jgi:hypothetical protein
MTSAAKLSLSVRTSDRTSTSGALVTLATGGAVVAA